jgi:hypothetical protein
VRVPSFTTFIPLSPSPHVPAHRTLSPRFLCTNAFEPRHCVPSLTPHTSTLFTFVFTFLFLLPFLPTGQLLRDFSCKKIQRSVATFFPSFLHERPGSETQHRVLEGKVNNSFLVISSRLFTHSRPLSHQRLVSSSYLAPVSNRRSAWPLNSPITLILLTLAVGSIRLPSYRPRDAP